MIRNVVPSRRQSKLRTVASALSLVAGLALAAPVAAQQQVTLSEAARLMQSGELDLQLIELEQQVAQEVVTQAKGERRPRVRLSLNYIQTQQEIINQDNTTFQEGSSTYPTMNVTLAITQPIYDAVRFKALPLARAEEELVKAQAVAAQNELSRNFVASFLRVASAQLQLDEAEAILRARTQLERDIGLLVDGGRADADRQYRAQGDVFAARADRAEAEMGISEALFGLHRFTGPEVEGVRFNANASVAQFRSFQDTFSPERLAELNPDVQVAKASLVVAQRQLERVRAAFRPTANLTLESEYEQTEGSLFGGGSTVTSTELGLELGWSVYEGGVRRSQKRESETRVKMAELRLEQAQQLAERRYQSLVAALQRSLEAVQATASDRRVASERYNAALEQVEAGRQTSEVVLESRLRRDTMNLRSQLARLRAIQLQAELYALFGALDLETLSQDFAGA
ncbi:Outer membrane protein TolC [Pseudooceanicola antarcticus]|uniref:Outer membrane protein TolC n=1 Tax=Pseudooceanicola antarcticus TaxID=1247613 RepID=A0A285JFY9_9RHOB|nr:TolC family protein [Pseudooceanicola antarcticus]SNY59194.1 Outer membrane protein TolC [Pseudooceanicola antarcticus]